MSDAGSTLLQEGVAAARAGDRPRARELLLRSVEYDRRNVNAWLWLSRVLDDVAERRLCLENVLTLAPGHALAQRELSQLTPDGPTGDMLEMPASPEAAPRAEPLGYRSESSYDDVWARETDLCAYCAHEVAPDDSRCPACRRRLLHWRYQYAKPSANLYVFLSLLIGATQLLFFIGLGQLLLGSPLPVLITYGAGVFILGGAALGVALRQSWAHALSVVGLLFVGVAEGLRATFVRPGVELTWLLDEAARTTGIVQTLFTVSYVLFFGSVALALLYGIFFVRADFDREWGRRLAYIDRRYSSAAGFYQAGRRHAQQGEWAAAIRYWQRAVGLDPTRATYQRDLGLAYARLGFAARGLDMLNTAQRYATSDAQRTALRLLVAQVAQDPAAVNPFTHPF